MKQSKFHQNPNTRSDDPMLHITAVLFYRAAVFLSVIIKAPITKKGCRGFFSTSTRSFPAWGPVFLPTEVFCVSFPNRFRRGCWSSRSRHGPAKIGSCLGRH